MNYNLHLFDVHMPKYTYRGCFKTFNNPLMAYFF